MAVKTTLKWRGDIKKADMRQAIIKALTRSGLIVVADAKTLSPVDTGDLKGSIAKRLIIEKLQMEVSTNLAYAFYVEFGTGRHAENGLGRQTSWVYYNEVIGMYIRTSGMKAQPFMRPALNNNKSEIKTIFIQEGRKAI
jgi:HK97 gp10 family phage protein